MTKLIVVSSRYLLKLITETDQWMLTKRNVTNALDSAAIFRFHYNTQTIQTCSQPLHIRTRAFQPLNTIVFIIQTTSTLVVEQLTLKTLYNGKSSPFIARSQLYPKHYVSLIDYPIDHVRYINIQAWLQGFRVKIAKFFKFLLSLNSQKILTNIEV